MFSINKFFALLRIKCYIFSYGLLLNTFPIHFTHSLYTNVVLLIHLNKLLYKIFVSFFSYHLVTIRF